MIKYHGEKLSGEAEGVWGGGMVAILNGMIKENNT